MQPDVEGLATEGSAVLLAGLRSENWRRVRNVFAKWLKDLGQDFYAGDLHDLKERQRGYTRGSLAERRWQRRLSEALTEAEDRPAAEESLSDLIKRFSPSAGPTGSATSDTSDAPPLPAGDHIDFRQGSFHGQVVGVQYNYGPHPPVGVLPGPGNWPFITDVDPISLGVRAGRRAEGESELPAYVVRDADRTAGLLFNGIGLIVITGGRLSGKTRTAWEHVDVRIKDGSRLLPDTTRIYAPAPGTDLRVLPELLRGRDGLYLLWLDELEGHLGEHGLEVGLLSQLSALVGVQVLATMRDELYDKHRFGDGPASRVLSRAVTVELGSRWSAMELKGLAQAAADDPRLDDARTWRGDLSVPEYLAVGPELWDLWRRAARTGGPHPRGHLLVRAAIDLARCGVTGDVPVAVLEEACGAYGAEASAEAQRESREEAFAWAAERRHGVTGLLVRGTAEGTWRPYGSLVADALRDPGLSEVPSALWHCALEKTDYDADVHRNVRMTVQAAFAEKAEAGDPDAMQVMGLLDEDAGDRAGVLEWFRKAVGAGKTELSGRVGEMLLERGKAEEALPFLRTAAEGEPDGRVSRLLGQAHLKVAEHWLGKAAGAKDVEASHQLGDLLLAKGDTDGASDLYVTAERQGYAAVARSEGVLSLLRGEHEAAKVFLERAAAGGDQRAVAFLKTMHGKPQTLEQAGHSFEEAMDAVVYLWDHAHLGAVLEKQGRLEEARRYYETGHELGDSYAAYRLAALLEVQGKPDEAKAWYRKAADMGHPAAQQALGENPEPPDTVKE